MIVEAARYGDQNAMDELTRRTYDSVERFCSVMGSKQDSQDLAQETFLRALKGKVRMIETDNLEAFMISIAKCVCSDWIKAKNKTVQLYSNLKSNRISQSFIDEIDMSEQMLETLDLDAREIILLNVILGFSYQDCSDILGIPTGTVRSRISRAKDSLKRNSKLGNLLSMN